MPCLATADADIPSRTREWSGRVHCPCRRDLCHSAIPEWATDVWHHAASSVFGGAVRRMPCSVLCSMPSKIFLTVMICNMVCLLSFCFYFFPPLFWLSYFMLALTKCLQQPKKIIVKLVVNEHQHIPVLQ